MLEGIQKWAKKIKGQDHLSYEEKIWGLRDLGLLSLGKAQRVAISVRKELTPVVTSKLRLCTTRSCPVLRTKGDVSV